MANSLVSRRQLEAPSDDEDSSWTSYIQNFLEMEAGTSTGCRGGNSFMVISDAASCAVGSGNCKKLMLRGGGRRRVAGRGDVSDEDDDDDLEDTASSPPVNSPKVGFLNNLEITSRDSRRNSQVAKRSKIAKEEMELRDKRHDYCTELKKRGLCLVPLSMLIDYLK